MKADLHLHSSYSWDSKVPIEAYVKKAETLNFSAISITDHNNISSHSIIDDFQKKTEVLLIPGQEVNTSEGHLLVYGWVDKVPRDLPMNEAIQYARKSYSDAVCIAAHPFDPFRGGKGQRILEKDIEGIEILNASAWFGFFNWRAARKTKDLNFIKMGNSDSHHLDEFGTAWNEYTTHVASVDQFLKNLTEVEAKGGRLGILRKTKRFLNRKFFSRKSI